MSIITVAAELDYAVDVPTSFLFALSAARTPHQDVRHERLTIRPNTESAVRSMWKGHEVVRVRSEPGPFKVAYQAQVTLTPELAEPPELNENRYIDLPNEILRYLNPSRYCESDKLAAFALKQFGAAAPGFNRVGAIAEWVHGHLTYAPGSTTTTSSACDVLLQRQGVCRDFAHVSIAMCRALCIPARYVSGYAVGLDPPDFHGFFEAYLGESWYLFDSTRMVPPHALVRIATGRDAADAAFANIIGGARIQAMKVSASELTGEIPSDPAAVREAVSTA